MKKLFLLFSHKLTPAQEKDACSAFGIDLFVPLPSELQRLWSDVPSDLESLDGYFDPLRYYLSETSAQGDVVLIQGDFGATCSMVQFVKTLGMTAVYATTKRDVVELKSGDKVIKKSVFEHVRFREYA